MLSPVTAKWLVTSPSTRDAGKATSDGAPANGLEVRRDGFQPNLEDHPLVRAQALVAHLLAEAGTITTTVDPQTLPGMPGATWQTVNHSSRLQTLHELSGLLGRATTAVRAETRELDNVRQELATRDRQLAEAHANTEKASSQRAALLDIDKVYANSTDPKAVMGQILDRATELLNTKKGSLMLYDPATDSLSVKVIRGVPDDVREGVESGSIKTRSFKPGEGVAGSAFQTRQPVRVLSTASDGRFVDRDKSFTDDILCVPLTTAEGKCLGVLNMTNKKDGHHFTPEDAELMTAICAPAALALQNAQRSQELATDSLTGLASRTGFTDYARAHWASGKENAVLMLDCDKFKLVNDTFGHEAGNHVLRQIGSRLKDIVGNQGLAARLSGDEFAIVLPGHDARQAEEIKQRIVTAFEQPVSHGSVQIPVHLSVGVATQGDDVSQLLGTADEKMYAEKRYHHHPSQPAVDGWLLTR